VKIVHAADLHLDSPLRGLERYEGAPVDEIRGATRRALENLVSLCREQDARLLLIAGDLFDGEWDDYSTGLFFAKQMAELGKAGVQVLWVRGNHDAASKVARKLRLPDNVRELPDQQPDSFVLEDLGIAVHGQSFPRVVVKDDLSLAYPPPVPGLVNIGLLHTAASGRDGHDLYAPCSVEGLVGKGYDYWALGHVHQREVLSSEPWVVFPGNLQGRHARETGPKGATLIEIESERIVSVEHCVLDVVRWAVCRVDASEASSAEDVVDLARAEIDRELALAKGRMLAVRVEVDGMTHAHAELAAEPERWINNVRQAALELAADDVWVEKVKLCTRDEVDLAALAERDDAVGQLLKSLADIRASDAELGLLAGELSELQKKLPSELREGSRSLRLGEPARLREILTDVEQQLLPRLLSREER